MRKHFIGLALFSFIVSAAAIVYAIFNVSKDACVSEVIAAPVPQYVSAEKTHCKMRRETRRSEIKPPIVAQAVFSMKTKNLKWELSQPRVNDFPILDFFVKDEKGVRLLDSIHTVRHFTDANAAKFSSEYLELNKISSKANLYLIPDATLYSDAETAERNVVFDINKAVPVTIDYDK